MVEVPAVPAVEDAEKKERERNYRREYKARKKREAAQASGTSAQAAQAVTFLAIIDGLAVSALGPDARMTDNEREMIAAPLARILDRLDPGVQEAIEKYSDPVLLVFGLAAYGSRLYRISEDNRKSEQRAREARRYDFIPADETSEAQTIGSGAEPAEGAPDFSPASPADDIMGAVFSGGLA